jgi:hypothetical protein
MVSFRHPRQLFKIQRPEIKKSRSPVLSFDMLKAMVMAVDIHVNVVTLKKHQNKNQ